MKYERLNVSNACGESGSVIRLLGCRVVMFAWSFYSLFYQTVTNIEAELAAAVNVQHTVN